MEEMRWRDGSFAIVFTYAHVRAHVRAKLEPCFSCHTWRKIRWTP